MTIGAVLQWGTIKGNLDRLGDESRFGAKPLILTENDYAAPSLTPVAAEGPGETTPPSPGLYNEKQQVAAATDHRALDLRDVVSLSTPAFEPEAGAVTSSHPSLPSLVEAASLRISQEGGVLTEEEAIAVLRAAGAPEEWIPDMLTIAWCESKYSPHAKGDSGNSLGWFQLWSGWFRAGEDPFDALTNARVAVRVREIRGRFGGGGGWSCAGLNHIP